MSPKRYREVFDVYSDVDNCGVSALLLLLIIGLIVVKRFKQFGQAPLCNLRPERAFRFGSFVLPLCARCTGLVTGVVASFICIALGVVNTVPILLAVVMALPLIVDWFLQWFGLVESTNTRRFVTGFICGFCFAPQGITVIF